LKSGTYLQHFKLIKSEFESIFEDKIGILKISNSIGEPESLTYALNLSLTSYLLEEKRSGYSFGKMTHHHLVNL
jgi:hypothetical protein